MKDLNLRVRKSLLRILTQFFLTEGLNLTTLALARRLLAPSYPLCCGLGLSVKCFFVCRDLRGTRFGP